MFRLKVREIAESKGYNMSSLSRASDVSFRTIKRVWKDSHYEVTLSILHRIARTLGVPTGELIEDIPEPK